MYDLNFQGEYIAFSSYVKTLGFYLDNQLKFNIHINSIISRVCFMLRRVYSVGVNFPVHVRKRIAHATLMPLIMYGIEIFSGTTHINMNRLEHCFRRVIRYVYGLHIHDHVTPFIMDFLGCSFNDFVKTRLLLLFYNIMKHQSPEYLVSNFIFAVSSRTHSLICPRFYSMIMLNSYVVRVCRLWNSLIPYNDRHFSHSSSSFKSLILSLI